MVTSSKNEDFIPSIILDERERGLIRESFSKFNCHISVRTLDYGDYMISDRIIIERKRGDDFVSSIFDNRLFIQLSKLKELFEIPILILENPKKMFERKFININSIYGALNYMCSKMHIPIYPTKNEFQTATVIYKIALREQSARNVDISNYIFKKSNDKLISQDDQINFLQGLIDVGYTKAEKYLRIFGNPYFILKSIIGTEFKLTKGGNPKSISGLMSKIKGTGPKTILRNQRLLESDYTIVKKRKEKTRQ